jgi:voltage-gated potassium channel
MRYPPLLIARFLVILLRPFASPSAAPVGLFLVLVFLTVIYAFRHDRSLAISLIVLGGIAVNSRFIGDYWRSSTFLTISHAVSFIAMVLVMTTMLSEVLRARTASTDLVIGAVCLYLVTGLAWTFLYYSIYLLSPGSIFSSPESVNALAREQRFTEVFYFSLSALTTIGSSGEESLTTMARQLAVVESAMGQLYLAVLISRLVGFSTTGRTSS